MSSPAAPTLDVVTVGNAIVDVIAHADDGFLHEQDLRKGSMMLIDEDRAHHLYGLMGPGTEMSGGSAANTAVGVASLGGRAGFVGKVRDDQLGEVFAHDLRASGVDFRATPAASGPPTARCLVLVTPDAERTMNTHLGIAGQLAPGDVDPDFIVAAAVTYGEGYLWSEPHAKDAMTAAFEVAHAAGRRTALSLSDGFCVEQFRDEFRSLISDHVDIVFGNEAEVCALFEVASFDEALVRARGEAVVWALTRGAQGCVVLADGEVHRVPAEPVAQVVDTTGAGDLYAAGFLFGLTRGQPPQVCGRLGGIAAAEIISHVGARPEVELATLVPADLA